jgi:hypothetical protein
MTMLDKCDVCHVQEPIGVASSGLGPMSLAYCRECAERGAEEEGMVLFTLWNCDGDLDNLADWAKEGITVFKDGEYLSLADYVERYKDYIAAEINKMNERFDEQYMKQPLLVRIYLRLYAIVEDCIETIRYGKDNHI